MGDTNQKELIILIKSVLDAEGYTNLFNENKRLAEQVDDLKHKHDEGKHSADNLGEAFGSLKEKVIELAAEYIAVSEAWGFVKESFRDSVQAEKLFSQLSATLKTVAHATDEEVESTKEWIEAAGLQYGQLNANLIPAFQRLISVTQNVEQSQLLMKIALDNSKASGEELGESVSKLTMYLQAGKVRGTDAMAVALRQLEAESRKAHKGHVDHAEVILKLQKRMEDQAAQIHTTANELDKQKVQWEHTREAIGKYLLIIAEALMPAMKGLAIGIGMVVAGLVNISAAIKWFISNDITLIEAFKDLVIQYFKSMNEAIHFHFIDAFNDAGNAIVQAGKKVVSGVKDANAEFAKMSGSATAMLTDITMAWDEQINKIGQGKKAAIEAAAEIGKAIDELDKPKKEKKGEKYGPFTEEFEQFRKMQDDKFFVAETALKKLNLPEKEYTEAYKKLLQGRLKNDNLSAEQRMKIEREVVEADLKLGKIEMDDAKKVADAKKKDMDALVVEHKKYSREWIKDEMEEVKRIMALHKGEIDFQIAGEKKLAALKKMLRKQDLADATAAASEMFSLAEGAFGKNKGISIAQTIISTFEGAQKAYSSMAAIPIVGPELGIVAAGLAIAAGAKRVQEIEKADVTEGTGFDDPHNDLMMRTAFKRWAQDASREMLGGLSEGLHGPGKQVINNNTTNINNPGQTQHVTHQNIHIDTLIDTDRQYKELQRRLDVAKTLNSEGLVK